MADIPDGIRLTPFDADFYDDPYAVYRQLRESDPVHQDTASFYEGGSWTISSYELVKTLLKDSRLSSDPRVVGLRLDPRADNTVTLREPGMMNLEGSAHHRLRSLVQRAFTPSSVEQFRDRIERIADRCLDEIADDEFDLVARFAKPLPTIVIAEYIGVDSKNHLDFKAWTDSLLKQGYPMPTEAQWREIVEADRCLREYVSTVIENRRGNPKDDLISRLIEAHEDQKLSNDEIVSLCFLLIGAGNFTTTDLISNAIFAWLNRSNNSNPSDDVIEETLRFDSPVLSVRRFAEEDIELQGNQIKKGSVVNLLIGAANHDLTQSEAASDHLSFGRGPHHCLGASLAKLEASIALKKFCERFPKAKIQSAKRSRRMDFRGFEQLIVAAS